jgi:hypothetical protein
MYFLIYSTPLLLSLDFELSFFRRRSFKKREEKKIFRLWNWILNFEFWQRRLSSKKSCDWIVVERQSVISEKIWQLNQLACSFKENICELTLRYPRLYFPPKWWQVFIEHVPFHSVTPNRVTLTIKRVAESVFWHHKSNIPFLQCRKSIIKMN